MIRVITLLLALFAAFASGTPARADIIGQACVIKGDTLMINGKRSFGKCRGGTLVRLFGVIAPDVDQTCDTPDGRKWQCGRAAAAMVLETVRDKPLICKGDTKNPQGELLAICQLNGAELNSELVRAGWVLAYPRHTVRYLLEEKEASSAKRGLWQAISGTSLDWRNR